MMVLNTVGIMLMLWLVDQKFEKHFLQFTMLVGIAIEIPFAIGEAVLGVEAYLIRYQTT